MEIKNYLETNGNDSTTIQYLLDMTKTVLRGEFTEIQSHLRKQEKSQMNKLNLYLMKVHKEEQTESKVSRRKEIMKIRAETDERDIKKAYIKIILYIYALHTYMKRKESVSHSVQFSRSVMSDSLQPNGL